MLTRAKGAVGDNTNSGGTPTAAEENSRGTILKSSN